MTGFDSADLRAASTTTVSVPMTSAFEENRDVNVPSPFVILPLKSFGMIPVTLSFIQDTALLNFPVMPPASPDPSPSFDPPAERTQTFRKPVLPS